MSYETTWSIVGGLIVLLPLVCLAIDGWLHSADRENRKWLPVPNDDVRIVVRVNPDRSALQSVVHYVQPEAAPDWTFTDCWTTTHEFADAMSRIHEGAPLA